MAFQQQLTLSPMEQLAKIIVMEAEAAEQMYSVLTEEQDALVNFSGDELEISVERCTEMGRRVNSLEKDRLRLLERAMKGTPVEKFINAPDAFERLLQVMDNRGGIKSKLKESRERLRIAVANVLQRNAVNKILLQHSMNYAQKNIRIITSNYSRQLVDQKI